MKRKILFMVVGLCLLLFGGLLWLSYNSVMQRIDVMRMSSEFQAAEAAFKSGKNKLAGYTYRRALSAFQRSENYAAYYPAKYSEYLTVGNICQKIRQPRRALHYYKVGLHYNPWSISLLTSMGGCAYRLGEYQTALNVLEKSQSIYPLKKELHRVLQKLRIKEESNFSDK